MALYVDENKYPQNYDWLSDAQVLSLLRAWRDREEMAREYAQKGHSFGPDSDYYTESENILRENEAIHEFLVSALNIHIEYGWSGYREKYFLAMYDDAVAENDYYLDIARDAEGDVDQYRVGGDYDTEEIDY